jgi:hypothetical protein
MTWSSAWLRGFLIFLYFVLATVYLPHFVLNLDFVGELTKFFRDLIGLVVWGAALTCGLWMLRAAQRRGVI